MDTVESGPFVGSTDRVADRSLTRAQPSVDVGAEFFEIASDFRDPRDAIREAISNAFDARAKEITVEARMVKFRGEDELVLEFCDDGEGMVPSASEPKVPNLEAFFGLGKSTRRDDPETIGRKGHGTKTYFNSRCIEVWSWRNGYETYAVMYDPLKFLSENKVPPYDHKSNRSSEPGKSRTRIVVSGYNRNQRKGFSHHELRDFILWRTKFGSVELELDYQGNADKKLRLKGLGQPGWEPLHFGHTFAKENFDIKRLREQDPATPTKYFVKKWTAKDLPLKGFPDITIDIVFYIEGDNAKDYNPMIRRRGRPSKDRPKEGMYAVEERYGLWACRDYIPIQNVTEWIAKGQRVGTKYHAFVNCQEFRLTANRGDIGNTREDLIKAVQDTTVEWFDTAVRGDKIYRQYEVELEREEIYREPKEEEEEFKKRKKTAQAKRVHRTLNKRLLVTGEIELVEPRQEAGVLSLFCAIYTLNPRLFDFRIIDYDSHKGYDALVEVVVGPEVEKQSFRFVEFKRTLEKEFKHSFRRLGGIVCWECNLGHDEQVSDISGEVRRLKITKPTGKVPYTKWMLGSDTEEHNIQVYVLKDFLRERCKLEFKPRTPA